MPQSGSNGQKDRLGGPSWYSDRSVLLQSVGLPRQEIGEELEERHEEIRRLVLCEALAELRYPTVELAPDEVPLRPAVGPRIAFGVQCLGLAIGQVVHELELRREVVWQLLLCFGSGHAKVIVEPHRFFHFLHPVATVEASIERTGRSGRTGVEESRVLDGEVFGAAYLPERTPQVLRGSEINLRERQPFGLAAVEDGLRDVRRQQGQAQDAGEVGAADLLLLGQLPD